HRPVDSLTQAGVLDDVVEDLVHLGPTQAGGEPTEVYVPAPRELRIHPDTQLEQGRGASVDDDSPRVGAKGSRHHPQQRALTRPVATDDPERLPLLDPEADLVERYDLVDLPSPEVGDRTSQGRLLVDIRTEPDGDVLDEDRRPAHR